MKFFKKGENTTASDLVNSAYEWVPLPWFGSIKRFQLRKINLIDVMTAGKFANVFNSILKAANDGDKMKEVTSDADKLGEFSAALNHIAEKAMYNPSYHDVFDRMTVGDEKPEDVAPLDTLMAIFSYQASAIAGIAKKKNI